VGFLERDQSAGELKLGEVVLGFLRPADQQGAVAVEPGVAGLDDPPPRSPSRPGSFELELVAAATDPGGVAAAGCELADPRVAVAAVQTQRLRTLGRRLGPLDRNRVEGRG
jgi:hypothetical protein